MTDWATASAILAAGIVLGTLLIYFVRRKPARVAVGDVELRDLEARRDALVQQLRELDATAADERTRLEIETAQVLRRIDEQKKHPHAVADSGPAVDPIRRATMIGFAWGAGSVLVLASLAYFVMQSAKTREGNLPVTGGQETSTMAAAQAPPDPAVQQLEAAVQKSPDDLNARIELAKAYLERDNMMGVFDQTQYVLKKTPDDPRALTYQALVRMAMGQSADSIAMLERATQKDPKLLDAWVGLAWANMTQGKTKEAEAAIEKAKSSHPEENARLDQVWAQMKNQMSARQQGGELPANHPPITSAETVAADKPIHITVDIDPIAKSKLTPSSVLFVIARNEGVAAGPPTAVKRLGISNFPITVDLSSADSMLGQPLPDRVRIEARIDSDGNPLTKNASDPSVVQDGVAAGSSVTLRLK